MLLFAKHTQAHYVKAIVNGNEEVLYIVVDNDIWPK